MIKQGSWRLAILAAVLMAGAGSAAGQALTCVGTAPQEATTV